MSLFLCMVYVGDRVSYFLHVAVQISPHSLLKRIFLLHFMLLLPLSNIDWPQRLGFISGLSILFHWSVCLFLCQYHTVLIGLVIQLGARYCDLSYFALLSQNCFGYFGSFMVPYTFLKCLFYICEVCLWYFNRYCVESINCFGWYGHFHEHSICFHLFVSSLISFFSVV